MGAYFGIVFMNLILVGLIISLAHKSYEMIFETADNVMRWVGFGTRPLGEAQGEQATSRTYAGAAIYSRDAAGAAAAKGGPDAANTGSPYSPIGGHEQHNRTNAGGGDYNGGGGGTGGNRGGNTPDGNTPSGNTPSGNTPDGNTPSGNTPDGNTPSGNTPSGNTPDGNTPDGNTPSGNTPGSDQSQAPLQGGDGGGNNPPPSNSTR